jgi:hypothetical protein
MARPDLGQAGRRGGAWGGMMRQGAIWDGMGRVVRRPGLVVGLVAACVCLLLAACASGTAASGATRTPSTTGTAIAGFPTATDQAALTPPPFPTYPAGGTPGTLGTGDVCDPHEQQVNATLPSNIPTYPGAQMHLGSINGANGAFGLCTGDSVQMAEQFYTAQLPANHWQQVANATSGSFVQITACSIAQCPASSGNTNLTVTIYPSTAVPGSTQILILY